MTDQQTMACHKAPVHTKGHDWNASNQNSTPHLTAKETAGVSMTFLVDNNVVKEE
jgi:hypothetical protein